MNQQASLIDEDPECQIRELLDMIVTAMQDRSAIHVRYEFKRPPTFKDYAEIEEALNGLLVSILESSARKKLPRGKRKLIFMDPSKLETRDDGSHDVTVRIDFSTLFPAAGE